VLSKISSDVNISRCIFDWELRFLLGGVLAGSHHHHHHHQ